MILWGMGISQHVHGTDNARCLIALCLMTGQVGKPGSGLHPLRGQNNVQGASDSGLIPMMYPGYQRVATPEAQKRFEKLWGQPLDPKPGLTVVEIVNAAYDGKIRGMYIMGENPAMSDPDVDHARAGMAKLEHMVVQDIFHRDLLPRRRGAAGHRLAREGRHGHQHRPQWCNPGRKAVEAPGEALTDLWIIVELAKRLGSTGNTSPKEVFNEMRTCMDSIRGITWERLERDSTVTYPCENEGDPASRRCSSRTSRRRPGAQFVPADLIPRPSGPTPNTRWC